MHGFRISVYCSMWNTSSVCIGTKLLIWLYLLICIEKYKWHIKPYTLYLCKTGVDFCCVTNTYYIRYSFNINYGLKRGQLPFDDAEKMHIDVNRYCQIWNVSVEPWFSNQFLWLNIFVYLTFKVY